MPWHAWLYLLLLALIAGANVVAERRAGERIMLVLARLAAVVVLALGVVFFYRAAGAGLGFMLALFIAVLLLAQKSVANAHRMRAAPMPAGVRIATALGSLALLPAIALGALAVWIAQGV